MIGISSNQERLILHQERLWCWIGWSLLPRTVLQTAAWRESAKGAVWAAKRIGKRKARSRNYLQGYESLYIYIFLNYQWHMYSKWIGVLGGGVGLSPLEELRVQCQGRGGLGLAGKSVFLCMWMLCGSFQSKRAIPIAFARRTTRFRKFLLPSSSAFEFLMWTCRGTWGSWVVALKVAVWPFFLSRSICRMAPDSLVK